MDGNQVAASKYLTYEQIVGDILKVLHPLDIKVIVSCPRDELHKHDSTWGHHIRSFYELWDSENPLTKGDLTTVKLVSIRIMTDVQDILRNPLRPENAA